MDIRPIISKHLCDEFDIHILDIDLLKIPVQDHHCLIEFLLPHMIQLTVTLERWV